MVYDDDDGDGGGDGDGDGDDGDCDCDCDGDGDGDDDDGDMWMQALAEAIRRVTDMNPDLSVEKIEIQSTTETRRD